MVVFDVVVVVAVVVVIVVVVVVIVLTVLEIVHIQFSTCKCSMVIMIQLVFFFHSFGTKSNFDAFEKSLSRIITQVVEVHLDLFGGDKHCSID